MRAYIAVKFHEDHRNRQHIERISSLLEKAGFGTVCITRDIEKWGELELDNVTLMQRTFREIDGSDVLVVDLTEKGVGLGIEAGYAFANDVPIVTIAKAGSPISGPCKGSRS